MIAVNSEIGKLKRVICHTPGSEIEKMTPESASNLLYDDILHGINSQKEHDLFLKVLKKHSKVYELKDLLNSIIKDLNVRNELLTTLFNQYKINLNFIHKFMELDSDFLANLLISGIKNNTNSLTDFLNNEEYLLPPLPNLFYTRDCGMVVNNKFLTGAMAYNVRKAESTIMHYIFTHNKELTNGGTYFEGFSNNDLSINLEGGDLHVIKEDIITIGLSERTSSQAVDILIENFRKKGKIKHVFAVILPKERSMIHLDMVFSMIDKNYAVVHEPIIMGNKKLGVVHIDLSKKENKLSMETDIFSALNKIGLEIEPIICGGKEIFSQEREQWMAGTNFVALAPGKIVGYGRNIETFKQLEKVANLNILSAKDIISGKCDINDYSRYAVSIEGAELSRGGGGGRCMTMPIERENVKW